VQTHVSELRRLLGQSCVDADPLRTHSTGYRLSIPSPGLDLADFDTLVRRAGRDAAAGRHASASEGFGAALRLWRGRPFADIRSRMIESAASSIEERRLLTVESKAEADLALGRYGAVVAEVSPCLAAHPLRERLRALMMLALYRRGCRASALTVYHAGRRALVDELGLEPSVELRRLHDAILVEAPVPADFSASFSRSPR
jgi:DNA-binding SARP family transcriptional activator